MTKQNRFWTVVTAVGFLCVSGQACGPRSIHPEHPQTANLKSSSKAPINPYKKVKPAEIYKYLETLYGSSQANRIRVISQC